MAIPVKAAFADCDPYQEETAWLNLAGQDEARSGILRGIGDPAASRKARAADRTSIRPFALVANLFKRFRGLLVTGYPLARTFFRLFLIIGDQPVRPALNRVHHVFHDCRARLFLE
ncbi:hypothetical protein UP10_20480 [Bradyrhizobium sp. LTSPM299]|jgi:hypothetical protein|uniref:hypothetical protein n=1 Tax=Bradyrhizobium sp. LTSPM299 TaxID=1619233 RepID=UPI0005CAF25A|nr:hypothetical protein [Bradyrhizobium sp. LTSPM299]KJC58990.1 hypothetical protein UP10_20480 [Bradyrhizobium sp. LTSPM299]